MQHTDAKRGLALAKKLGALCLAAALLSGCSSSGGDGGGGRPSAAPGGSTAAAAISAPEVADPSFVRTPPPVALPSMGSQQVSANDAGKGRSAILDYSNLSDGYIAVQCTAPADQPVRLLMFKDSEQSGQKLDYSFTGDGNATYFPLTMGDGKYVVILYIYSHTDDVTGPMYDRFIVQELNLTKTDEFTQYLLPNIDVNYNENSDIVAFSHELTKNCQSDLEVAQQIYSWIAKNVKYDEQLAEAVSSPDRGLVAYLPSPDATLKSKTGICYDYASLAAAMLRANGIPTKLVKGNVMNGGQEVYHAWNMIWLEETGWISAGLEAPGQDWSRIDTTFAAGSGGGIGNFIGDGENYTDFSYS